MTDKRETAENIILIVPQIMRIVTAELRQTPYPVVPAHLGVLSMLAHQSANLSELAEATAVSLPTMSNTISYMVREGWVQRTRAQHDRRMLLIEITPAGQTMVAEIYEQLISHLQTLLNPLSTTDEATLQAGLTILQTVFEKLPPIQTKENLNDNPV
jgi:DNA-binding MarR family transcriptional regulator